MDSLGFSRYGSCHLWLFPFHSGGLLFSCLIVPNRTSNKMLNGDGSGWHPWIFPNLRGKAFTVSPLSMVLAAGFS